MVASGPRVRSGSGALHTQCKGKGNEMDKLELGQIVIVHLDPVGVFVAKVHAFERDGNVAVLMPTRSAVKDVFPNGYTLGRGHWPARLELAE